MEAEYKLTLRKPARIAVESADGKYSARIDVWDAWRLLSEAQKEPSEPARWKSVLSWMATKLSCSPDDLAENVAWHFHEAVMKIGNVEQGEIAKNLDLIAYSPLLIPVSPATIAAGQSRLNELGETTFPSPLPN